MKAAIPAPGAGFGTVRPADPGRLRKAGRRTRWMPGFAGTEASPATRPDECGAAAPRSRARHSLATTISPSSTQRAGNCDRSGSSKLGKVAVQRFFVAALDQDLVPVAENQRAKPIPLRFENPCSAGGQFADSLGEHRQDRRVHRKVHGRDLDDRLVHDPDGRAVYLPTMAIGAIGVAIIALHNITDFSPAHWQKHSARVGRTGC